MFTYFKQEQQFLHNYRLLFLTEEISPSDVGQKGFNKTFNANMAYMIFGRVVTRASIGKGGGGCAAIRVDFKRY